MRKIRTNKNKFNDNNFFVGKTIFRDQKIYEIFDLSQIPRKKKFLVFDENKSSLPYYVRRIFFGKHFPHSFRPDIFRTTHFIIRINVKLNKRIKKY